MRTADIIEKKRDGHRLSRAEFDYFLTGVANGEIPDYQTSAWCMAIFFRGLDEREAVDMTKAMVATGSTLDLSGLARPTVDKHSTGGVGDKTSLVLGPILAALGAAMVKMSGRALGHTGGTLDKLESIPGLRTDLEPGELLAQAERIGLVIAGQTGALVPADKKLYALRDVTGTVPSIPLIAASIMSKKLAAGAGTILLDVKYGSGALLPEPRDGRHLAALMSRIGSAVGKRVCTCLTSMEQPLGQAIGNALEVREAIDALKGAGPEDLRELCLTLATELLILSGLSADRSEARNRTALALANGAALDKFREMVAAQGGNTAVVDYPELLPRAKATTTVAANSDGYLAKVDTAGLGRIAIRLGAGRAAKDDSIDPAAGLVFLVRLGQRVETGTPLAELHTNKLAEIEPAQADLRACLSWSERPLSPPLLILDPPEAIA